MLAIMAARAEFGSHLRQRIAPVFCGVGPIEAAVATTLVLLERQAAGRLPRVVLSLGSAGSRRFKVGSVYQISSVVYRDIDASRIGIPKGVTPFADVPNPVVLATPWSDLPSASLSTGGRFLGPGDEDSGTDLADMETFAVWRACSRFGVPLIGLRGVSDGTDADGAATWDETLRLLDRRLAEALDTLPAVQ